MPVEIIKVAMKPVNFFDKNPALDVPPSTQDFNKSSLLSEMHQVRLHRDLLQQRKLTNSILTSQGATEGKIDSDGAACCDPPSSKL